jgi:hypothetical protein
MGFDGICVTSNPIKADLHTTVFYCWVQAMLAQLDDISALLAKFVLADFFYTELSLLAEPDVLLFIAILAMTRSER